jgi:RNA polymerase sigma factor (sigma-70 family)
MESGVEDVMRQIAMMAHRSARKAAGRQDGVDLAQDVILECLVKLRSGEWRPPPGRSLRSFVLLVVRRRATDFFRSRQRRWAREMEYGRQQKEWARMQFAPDLETEERELDAWYKRALDTLPHMPREVHRLVVVEEASHRLAAKELGISRQRVTEHMATVQQRLRQELSPALNVA